MKLYIIRHGETDWNRARKVQGRSNIALNENGIRLAEETRDGMKNIPFDRVYTSPLIRAKQTAEIVMGERKIPIIEEERIQELSFGEYEGMNCSEENTDPRLNDFQKFFKDTAHYVPGEGGETVENLMKRTGEFLQEIYADPQLQDKTILLSTHGAAMTALLNNIRESFDKKDFWKYKVPPNCAVTIVDVRDQKPVIEQENCIFYSGKVNSWFDTGK